MRDIKFRAWDENLEVMFGWEYVMIDKDGTWIKSEPTKSSLDNNLILMQYTGLKDKNGKDIYKGDIVKHTCAKNYVEFIGIVVFESGCYCVHYKNGKFDSWLFDYDYEVIGNIYENPELLQ